MVILFNNSGVILNTERERVKKVFSYVFVS